MLTSTIDNNTMRTIGRGAETDRAQDRQPAAQQAASAAGDTDGVGTPADPETQDLPLDQVFELLKNSRRRRTLSYLKAHDGKSTVSDLAEHIAAIENDVSVEAITSAQRKRVYVGLYQCHLPKMDDTAVIEYDQDRGTVELTDRADQLEPYLGESSSTAWPLMYGGVTAVGIGLFGLQLVGAAPAGLTPTVVALVVLGGATLCSTLHAVAESDSLQELLPER